MREILNGIFYVLWNCGQEDHGSQAPYHRRYARPVVERSGPSRQYSDHDGVALVLNRHTSRLFPFIGRNYGDHQGPKAEGCRQARGASVERSTVVASVPPLKLSHADHRSEEEVAQGDLMPVSHSATAALMRGSKSGYCHSEIVERLSTAVGFEVLPKAGSSNAPLPGSAGSAAWRVTSSATLEPLPVAQATRCKLLVMN